VAPARPRGEVPPASLPAWTAAERRFLAAAILVALALRFAHWASVAKFPWFDFLGLDAAFYDDWARRILREGLQAKDPYFMGPLYPHVVAAVYAVFGESLDAVRAVQVVLSGVTVWLVHLLGRRFGGARLGGVASGMAALYGPFIAYSVSIIYPTINVLMTTSALLLLHEAERRRSLPVAFAAGACVGIDALGRGNVLLFAPVGLLWLAAAWGRPRAPVRPATLAVLPIAATFGSGVLAGIAPATIHNLRTDDPTLLTTNGGLNFYIGNGPMASGGHETPVLFLERPDGTVERVVADLQKDVECRTEAELAVGHPLTYTEVSRFWFDETLRFIRANPGTFLSRTVMKTVHFWSAYEIPQIEHFDYFRKYSAVLRGPVLTFGVVGALALAGMVLAWRRRAEWALLYGFVVTYSFATILFFILDRYRLPILPALLPFAAHTVLVLRDAVARRRPARAGVVAAGVAVAMLAMRANVYGIDEDAGVAQVIYRLGIVADSEGKLEEAVGYYRETLALKPDYDKCHLNLGVDLARLGRLEEAMGHLDVAQRLNPGYYRAPFNRGVVLEQLGRFAEARDAYRRAVEIEPRYLIARASLAEMLFVEDERAGAREEARAVLAYDGRWEGDLNPAARERARRLVACLDELERAAPAGHDRCFAGSDDFRRAELARLRGRDDEALRHLRRYFEAGGSCAEAYRALGGILVARREWAGAEDAYRRAARADASLPGVQIGLARLAAGRGDAEAATAALRREIALDDRAAEPCLEMGLVLERLAGDPAAAERWYAKYRELGGDPAVLSARRTDGSPPVPAPPG